MEYHVVPLQVLNTDRPTYTPPSLRRIGSHIAGPVGRIYPALGGLCMISSPALNLIPTDLRRLQRTARCLGTARWWLVGAAMPGPALLNMAFYHISWALEKQATVVLCVLVHGEEGVSTCS